MRPTAELVIAAQSQDRAAFAELIRRYERAVIATAWSVLHDYHAAQDVAQDSFVIAYCRLATLRDPRTFGTWLLTLTRREALRRSRRQKVLVPIDSVAEPALTTTAAAWDPGSEELVDAVGRLPEHERIVVVFHYLDGHSVMEVAAMTGRPVGTVTKQISRGLNRLRRWLAEVPK
jgi:RNA polymerase sigma-70 factor (ECF subfamily)